MLENSEENELAIHYDGVPLNFITRNSGIILSYFHCVLRTRKSRKDIVSQTHVDALLELILSIPLSD